MMMILWVVMVSFSFLLVLFSVMFITLMERKVLGVSQNRTGPNKNSIAGFFQPGMDGMKLLSKEVLFHPFHNKILFLLGPVLMMGSMMLVWTLVFSAYNMLPLNYNLFMFLSLLGVSVYLNLISGWSSNSKYSMLGAIRAMAQTISYEISMSLILFCFFSCLKTLNFIILEKESFIHLSLMIFPVAMIWLLSVLAECNRAPFDFSEGESELVSGFNTEYKSSNFALLFIAEYGFVIFFSLFSSILLFSMSMLVTLIMSMFVLWTLVFIRSVFPRFRYDQLMILSWLKFLPVVTLMSMLSSAIMIF